MFVSLALTTRVVNPRPKANSSIEVTATGSLRVSLAGHSECVLCHFLMILKFAYVLSSDSAFSLLFE